MKNKVVDSFDAAVADIQDGASIMIGGFGPPGFPQNLVAALIRTSATDLTIISNRADQLWAKAHPGILVAEGRVKKVYCAFSAATHPSQAAEFDRLHEAGTFEAELMPQGTLVERMRAAAGGLGGIYTPAGVGTEIAVGKEHKQINGKTYILELPLAADFAFIRASRADTCGNLQFDLTQRNFAPIMAMAASTTLVEIEDEIVPIGAIDPSHVHTPGICVDRIIKIPPAPEGLWTTPTDRRVA
jgi:3-oxoacid CoA-transferase A subunit